MNSQPQNRFAQEIKNAVVNIALEDLSGDNDRNNEASSPQPVSELF